MQLNPIKYRSLLSAGCLLLLVACGGDSGSSGGSDQNTLSQLPAYVGTWVANCTTDYPTFVYTLSITDSGQYWSIEREYDSEANCGVDAGLLNTTIHESSVTHIMTNENNDQYEDLYVSNGEVRKTPFLAGEVTDWNTNETCGKTDWSLGSEATFNEANPGTTNSGSCYQINTSPAVMVDGSTLRMNGRGGFDGNDPAEYVYTRTSETPLLSGQINGIPWMAVSGKITAGFEEGNLFYTLYDSYTPDICNGFPNNAHGTTIFELPEATGEYTLGLPSPTLTLFDGETNIIITSGTTTLQTVDADTVTGTSTGSYDDGNFISGWFTATRCDGL